MEETISLKISMKSLIGQALKVFFTDEKGRNKKVLKFTNVAAFIDTPHEQVETYILQVREGGGSYGLDMAMQTKRPEVEDYLETFLFVDKADHYCTLRVLSEKVEWRDFDDSAYGDNNY